MATTTAAVTTATPRSVRTRSASVQRSTDRDKVELPDQVVDGGGTGVVDELAGEAGLPEKMLVALARRVIFKKIREGLGSELRCLICGSAPLGPAAMQLEASRG